MTKKMKMKEIMVLQNLLQCIYRVLRPPDTDQPVQLCSLISVSPLFETELGHRLPKECSSKSDQIAQS